MSDLWRMLTMTWVLLLHVMLVLTHRHDHKEGRSLSDEQRLFKKMMKNYEKSVRPVSNSTTPVVLQLGITLTQIFDMDEKNQVLTLNVWLDQKWTDEKLRWNPKKYGGLETLRMPCDFLWLPDIVLYNSVEDYTTPYMRSLAMVSHDGSVFWPPIVRFRSSCKVDITYFPFDDQICHMKLGSWAYDGFQLDVLNTSDTVDMSNYVDNGEWELVESRAVRNVIYYSCCPEPFPDVTFWFHLRRRTTYYTFNIIIPCVMLSLLTLGSFVLPAESGEKVSLGLTVLLAFSVFMLLIAESMPATSEFVPLIGVYLTVVMAMTSMSVVFSVFILHLHHRGGHSHRAPSWLRKLALSFMSRAMCMCLHPNRQDWDRGRDKDSVHTHIQPGYSSFNEGFRVQSAKYRVENGQLHRQTDSGGQRDDKPEEAYGGGSGNAGKQSCFRYRQAEAEILRYLRLVLSKQDKLDSERLVIQEWEQISRVFDRLFFYIFFLVAVFATISLLVLKPMSKNVSLNAPRAPHTS